MNTQVQVKVQVPMSKALRDNLAKRSKTLGFDSVQAFIRFWATAETDGRKVRFGEDDWGEPSDEAAARVNKAAEDAVNGIGVSGPFYTVEDMMKHLDKL